MTTVVAVFMLGMAVGMVGMWTVDASGPSPLRRLRSATGGRLRRAAHAPAAGTAPSHWRDRARPHGIPREESEDEMPRQRRLPRPVVPLAAGVLLAWLTACGGSGPTVAPTTPGGAFPAGEPIDLVYISNSAGIGVAEKYGKLAAEALGREVRVHDHTGMGSLTQLLRLVKSSLADEVAGAEIIVLFGDGGDLVDALPRPNILTCVEAGGDPGSGGETPVVPTVEDWRAYRDVWDQMYNQIWDLREGRPTILRAQDVWNPFLAQWREAGIEPECTATWETQTQVVREAAEANNAVFVSVFDVFNGPNHDEDVVAKGWIGDDGKHPNDRGRAAIAEALAAVGFEASEPPR